MAYWKIISKQEDLKEHSENPLVINDETQEPELVCDCCDKDLYDVSNDKRRFTKQKCSIGDN